MPNQPIKLDNVEYEMVCEMTKQKNHQKNSAFVRKLVRDQYNKK